MIWWRSTLFPHSPAPLATHLDFIGFCLYVQAPATELQKEDKLELLHISLLREYLDLEFQQMELPGGHDVERCIDDFIFLCFFVGNDFLPHSPTLDIAEGAINILLDIYKVERPNLPGYITQVATLCFSCVQMKE